MFSLTGMYKIKLHVVSNIISRIIKYLWKVSEAGRTCDWKINSTA